MRLILSTFIVLLMLSACHRPAKVQPQQPRPHTPAALEENKSSYSTLSKRGFGDLVAELYEELKNDSPALQDLDKRIDATRQQKRDSTDLFTTFDAKNDRYYSTALTYAGSISDSVLKQQIRTLLNQYRDKYRTLVAPQAQLAAALDNKDLTLTDLYTVLKLTKTMAVMENYQQTHLPATQPLKAANAAYDQTIRQTKAEMKK